MSTNSILVVLGQAKHSTLAVQRAAVYARRMDAVLHLEVFDHYAPIDRAGKLFGREVGDRARHDFLDEHLSALGELARGLADQGLQVEVAAHWTPDKPRTIVSRVLEVDPALVLKDATLDAGPEARMHPSADDRKLMRLCPAPLMLVRPDSGLLPLRVLAAVDVDPTSDAPGLNDIVIEAAQSCGKLSGADTEIAAVFALIPYDMYGSGFVGQTYDLMRVAHRKATEALAARHQVPLSHALHRDGIDVSDAIIALAQDRGSSLVVFGATQHSGWDRLIFGSTAEALIHGLVCDLLIVKPAGFAPEAAAHLKLKRDGRVLETA